MSRAARLAGVRRLGLFGGSFDPVHNGHLHVARAAQERFELDHVLFVPAARPPHKPGRVLAEAADRLAMVERVVATEARWSATDLELHRAGPSYTLDTVQALETELGLDPAARVFLLIGSDNLPGLPEWSRVEDLLARVEPVVVYREDSAGAAGADRGVLAELGAHGRLSPEALARLERGFLGVPPVAVSSTALRARIGAGEDVSAELPPGVWEYIRERGIYGCPR